MKTPAFLLTLLLAALASPATHAQEPASWKFSFGSGIAASYAASDAARAASDAAGFTPVAPTAVYSKDIGYGFEPGANVTTSASGVVSERPFYFSVALPEGNFQVTVTLGDPSGPSNTTVKSESRRLMLQNVPIPAGQSVTRTFIVNTRTPALPPVPRNAPGGDAVRLDQFDQGSLDWDDKLTLEFNGYRPSVQSIAITPANNLPTVFLAGDSTVTDQGSEPGASWGQMLPRFLKPNVAVANHAQSGETLKTFLTALRLDKILSQMKAGDYLFIQFCHNDEKASWPQSYVTADATYPAYLKAYIAEARRRGATPVLVTPMQRLNFDAEGHVTNSHGGYPDAMRLVAQEENVPLIDLEKMSRAFYEANGAANYTLISRDRTHETGYGAYELAKCIVLGIQQNKLGLANSIVDDFGPFDPAHPDPVANVNIPASPRRNTLPPAAESPASPPTR